MPPAKRASARPGSDNREENLSAQEVAAKEGARLPGADGHPGREESPPAAASERPGAPCLLRRPYRLRGRDSFQEVIAQGTPIRGRVGVVFLLPGKEAEEIRVGISVPARLGPAVKRNRIRRRLREAVRHLLPRLRPGIRLVIVARAGAASEEFPRLCRELESMLRRGSALGD